MIYSFLLRLSVFAALLVFPVAGAMSAPSAVGVVDRAAAAGFAPHKALYDVRLASTKSGSQIVNVAGQMLYEWHPDCDAWLSTHRFTLNYEYADSPAMRIDSDFTTYEPFDEKSIDFTSQRKRDGEVFEILRGRASLKDDKKGEAIYSMPKGLEFDLPKDAMFPMTHSLNVVDMIKQGKKRYHGVVFDGSDAEGPVEINAIIGKAVSPDQMAVKPSKAIDAALLSSPARNIRMAYFPLNQASESSDYEMNIVFHDNGIISDMVIEYDDFSVTQRLVALEPVKDACKQRKSGVQ